jgi:hypothetical protein
MVELQGWLVLVLCEYGQMYRNATHGMGKTSHHNRP